MGYSLDSTLLGGTAAVMRNRRDVDDVQHLVAERVQRTHRRLTARARALDAHFDGLHAVVASGATSLLGGDLGGKRGRLARTAETGAASGRPRQRVALAIGDGDDGVVEGGLHVSHGIRDNALDLLLGLDRLGHNSNPLLLDRATRTLAGAGVGTRALTAHRQATTVAKTAVATQIHQTLDGDTHLATQIAFDNVLGDFVAELLHLTLAEGLDRRGRNHSGVRADLLGPAAADAVDALQADPDVFLDRQIDTRDARHDVLSPMRFVRGKRAILT